MMNFSIWETGGGSFRDCPPLLLVKIQRLQLIRPRLSPRSQVLVLALLLGAA